jgi:hypothetical protein
LFFDLIYLRGDSVVETDLYPLQINMNAKDAWKTAMTSFGKLLRTPTPSSMYAFISKPLSFNGL